MEVVQYPEGAGNTARNKLGVRTIQDDLGGWIGARREGMELGGIEGTNSTATLRER